MDSLDARLEAHTARMKELVDELRDASEDPARVGLPTLEFLASGEVEALAADSLSLAAEMLGRLPVPGSGSGQ